MLLFNPSGTSTVNPFSPSTEFNVYTKSDSAFSTIVLISDLLFKFKALEDVLSIDPSLFFLISVTSPLSETFVVTSF